MTPLARAIGLMEGAFLPASRAARNNNPGNLRPPKGQKLRGQTGLDPAGFAIFPDMETGWAALDRQITLDAKRGHTVETFLAKYAPPSENNTANYLAFVCKTLGVGKTTLLSELPKGE